MDDAEESTPVESDQNNDPPTTIENQNDSDQGANIQQVTDTVEEEITEIADEDVPPPPPPAHSSTSIEDEEELPPPPPKDESVEKLKQICEEQAERLQILETNVRNSEDSDNQSEAKQLLESLTNKVRDLESMRSEFDDKFSQLNETAADQTGKKEKLQEALIAQVDGKQHIQKIDDDLSLLKSEIKGLKQTVENSMQDFSENIPTPIQSTDEVNIETSKMSNTEPIDDKTVTPPAPPEDGKVTSSGDNESTGKDEEQTSKPTFWELL